MTEGLKHSMFTEEINLHSCLIYITFTFVNNRGMQNLLNIYRASAGAGKTFFLTESFLKLAFRAPDYSRKILAVTFTNKAAEEMKSRITEQLNLLTEKPEKADHLSVLQAAFPEMSLEEIRQRAESIRDEILHNYSLFSVSTIDSFVQKVVRAFTFEMNLRSNYNVQLDTDAVMSDLRERLFEKLKDDERLLAWLIKFAEYKIGENKSWNYNKDIEELSREILKEDFQSKKIAEHESEDLDALRKRLSEVKNDFEKKMLAISDKAVKAVEANETDYNTLGQKVKYIGDHLTKKIKKGEYEPTKTVRGIADNPDAWSNKGANEQTLQKIAQFHAAAGPLIKEAVDLYINDYPIYASANEVLKNFYSFGLLSDIAALLPEYRNDNNELLISDTTFLLKELIQNNDAPFIYEKTGNRYAHILIDEFQDTSNFQWENFEPLIKNSLAAGNFNLLVGDIKQSIYSWRGGDWTLLLHRVKDRIGAENVFENNLPYNWRSAKNIVRFNNTIFERLPKILQEHFNAEVKSKTSEELNQSFESEGMFTAIEDAYRQSAQKIPKNQKNLGFAYTEFVLKEKGELKADVEQRIGNKVGQIVNELLSKGHKAGDIGLLVRTGADAKKITDLLYAYQKEHPESKTFDVISQASAELSGSASVKIIVAAMKYLHEPKDQIAKAELLYEYMQIRQGESTKLHRIFSDEGAARELLPKAFKAAVSELNNMQLYELTERLIDCFELRTNMGDFEFIRSFQDLVFDFVSKKGNDLHEFIQWWEEKGKTESLQTSDKHNAVKILTVHKSKGLGIDNLIVPFANWSISPQSRTNFWAKDDSGFFGAYEYLPLNYKSALADTVFRRSYHRYTLHGYTEALNLLYVALTRAKLTLTIFAPVNANAKSLGTVADLLLKAIKTPANNEESESGIFTDTLSNYTASEHQFVLGEIPYKEEKTEYSAKSFFKESYPGNGGSLKPEISYQSKDFFIESIETIKEKVDSGSLMHRIFAEIRTPKDTKGVVEQLHTEGYISKEEKGHLYEKVQQILSRPKVAEWFREGLEVISERSIITEEGLTRIPDRVVIADKRISVIDFKFGKERPEHFEQINEYKALLEKIYGSKVVGYLYYAETDREVVV